MKLRFLGKDSKVGDSPTLFETDRSTYLVQGWKVIDPRTLSQLNLSSGETCVEVPSQLMEHLPMSRLIEASGIELPIIFQTNRDTYIIKGREVTDAEALNQLHLPIHETVVEVSAALPAAVRNKHAVVDT